MPPHKLKRACLTLVGQIIYCIRNDENTSLDRLGSHVEENNISTLRYLCKGDNNFENVKQQEARHEYICREYEYIFYKPQPKRLNVGGCPLKKVNFDIILEISPKNIPEAPISTMYKNVNQFQIISIFIKQLISISQKAPYQTFHMPSPASNATILNRLISYGFERSSKKTTFLELEKRYIDELLINKQNICSEDLTQLFNCTEEDLNKLIQTRIEILSKRDSTDQEDNAIIFYIPQKISFQYLCNNLCLRVVDDIKRRIKFIKNKFKT